MEIYIIVNVYERFFEPVANASHYLEQSSEIGVNK